MNDFILNENSYLTLEQADAYMRSRLYHQIWIEASAQDKQNALIMAAREMQNFFWLGAKTAATQKLAWPRTGIEGVDPKKIPEEVQQCQIEIAFVLLRKNTTYSQEINPFRYARYLVKQFLKTGLIGRAAWVILLDGATSNGASSTYDHPGGLLQVSVNGTLETASVALEIQAARGEWIPIEIATWRTKGMPLPDGALLNISPGTFRARLWDVNPQTKITFAIRS